MIGAFERSKFHYANGSLSETAYYLKSLFEQLSKSAKIPDDWNFKWGENLDGLSVTATSSKSLHEYQIGFLSNQFFIESNIYNPELLKSMKNDFWSVLASLDLMGCFNFSENAGVGQEVNIDLKPTKSSVYNLIRNHVLLEEHSSWNVIDIGSFESSWHLEEPTNKVIEQAVESLKGIYRLNYLMYRIEYLRIRGKKKQ